MPTLPKRSHWWRREAAKGSGFKYRAADGKRITEPKQLARITSLAIPPAWIEVRINPTAGGRLQATGVDNAGRTQYLYHHSFLTTAQRKKFEKIERFGMALPSLRQLVDRHISISEPSRDKVLSTVVRLIDVLCFRIGSEANVRRYHTYGVTTLRNRHLTVAKNGTGLFRFIGKHHVVQRRILEDQELTSTVRTIQSLQGPLVFQYQDESGKLHQVMPREVNQYIKDAMGNEFSARDFRVWSGTVHAAAELARYGPADKKGKATRYISQAMKSVAEKLGNTPAVCRSAYVHPVVAKRYLRGVTIADYIIDVCDSSKQTGRSYSEHEAALLKLFTETIKR